MQAFYLRRMDWTIKEKRRSIHAFIAVALLLAIISGHSSAAVAGQLKLYWSEIEDNWIRRANLDGTDAEKVVETPGGVRPDIAFDPVERKMYWPSPVVEGIQRGNYDGTEVETVITGLEIPTHVSIDSVNRKAYWIDDGGGNSIWRSDLDGANRELLADNVPSPTAIEVDPLNGFYYWAESIFGRIYRTAIADISQTDVIFDENEFGRPTSIRGLAIDPVHGHAYAADAPFDAIIQVPLDGGEAVDWVTENVYYPQAIVVDSVNGRVIWSNENVPDGGAAASSNISSVNFQGLDQRIEFVPLWNPYWAGYVRQLAIVEVPIPEPSVPALACFAILTLSHQRLGKRAGQVRLRSP
jgi:DNA-binding beta-propeller fold protein YncE